MIIEPSVDCWVLCFKSMKKCKLCEQIKSLSDFSPDKIYADRLSRLCKKCNAKRVRDYYKRNSKKIIAKAKLHYLKNKDSKRKYNKLYYNRDLKNQRKRAMVWYYRQKIDFNVFVLQLYHKILIRKRQAISYQYLPVCTREEFYNFAINSSNLFILFNQWIENNYKHNLVPTTDRINIANGYTLDNIQFLTLRDNIRKSKFIDKYVDDVPRSWGKNI